MPNQSENALPHIICGVDVETTLFSMNKPEVTLIGVALDGIEVIFQDVFTFLHFISKTSRDLILAFHHLQFDFNMIFQVGANNRPLVGLPEGCSWSKRLFNINGQFPRFASIEIRKNETVYKMDRRRKKKKKSLVTKTTRIYFLDNMNFIKAPLGKLMEIYTPQYHKAEDFALERVWNDIKATREIYLNNFYKTYEYYKHHKPIISIASMAFRDLKDRTGYKWEGRSKRGRKIRPNWLVKAEQESYRGGIVWVNPDIQFKWVGGVKYYDINSEYPFVMRSLKVPVNYLKTFNHRHRSDSKARDMVSFCFHREDTFSLFWIKAETTDHILPVRTEDGLQLPIGEIEGWYCENELYPALPKLINLQLIKEHRYKAIKGLFAPFVDYWYEIKVKYSKLKAKEKTGKYDPIINFAKIMLNSAYGRFGMRTKQTLVLTEEDKIALFQEAEPLKNGDIYTKKGKVYEVFDKTTGEFVKRRKTLREYTYREENGVSYLEYKSDFEASSAVTIIASAITAGARALLMSNFDRNKVLYTDTDSQSRIDYMETSDALGGWKIEKEGRACFIDKKHYLFWENGYEHNLELLEGMDYDFQQIDKFNCNFKKLHLYYMVLFNLNPPTLKLKGIPKRAKQINEWTWVFKQLRTARAGADEMRMVGVLLKRYKTKYTEFVEKREYLTFNYPNKRKRLLAEYNEKIEKLRIEIEKLEWELPRVIETRSYGTVKEVKKKSHILESYYKAIEASNP